MSLYARVTLLQSPPFFFFLTIPPPPRSTLFPYTTLFRSHRRDWRFAGYSPSVSDVTVGMIRIAIGTIIRRSEEHTSELQSHSDLVCRLLLEKKKHKQ